MGRRRGKSPIELGWKNIPPNTPKCTQCGVELQSPRKLLKYCSYPCRGQHEVVRIGEMCPEAFKGAKNIRKIKALKGVQTRYSGTPTFARVNEVSWRMDTMNKKGAGWLIDVSPISDRKAWVARVGDRGSEPMTLDEAKGAAIAMHRSKNIGDKRTPDQWIEALNAQAAGIVDPPLSGLC